MIFFIVVLTLLNLLVATEPEPGRSASFPAPAGNARGGVAPGALRRTRSRHAGRHWPAQ
jgi:hypothetical protein